MLNTDNKTQFIPEEKAPLRTTELAPDSSYGCRRPVGEGYYNEVDNKTYLCWNGRGMDVWLRTFDHGSKTWGEPEKVCENGMFGMWDYHNYAVMVRNPVGGEPVIFHAVHSNSLYQLRKRGGTWKKNKISDDRCCYPAPVVFKHTIYLFYSRNEDQSYPYRPLCMIKSTDGGDSWSEPVTVIDSEKLMADKFDEVYLCGSEFVPGSGRFPDRIQLTWTMWGGPKGHAQEGCGAYFAYFSLEDERMYGADGSLLGQTANHDAIIQKCLIELAPPDRSHPQSTAAVLSSTLEDGSPIVLYGVHSNGCDYLKEAVCSNGKWQAAIACEGVFNLKDLCQSGKSLEASSVIGDKLLLSRRPIGQGVWKTASLTTLPLNNGADSYSYMNFIDHFRPELKLIGSQIERGRFDRYYEGLWSTVVFGESN